jgi:hypothetical protein
LNLIRVLLAANCRLIGLNSDKMDWGFQLGCPAHTFSSFKRPPVGGGGYYSILTTPQAYARSLKGLCHQFEIGSKRYHWISLDFEVLMWLMLNPLVLPTSIMNLE